VVKRQKEVKDIAATRLREHVPGGAAGSTRATCVFFTNFGVAYTGVSIFGVDGGEPIQRFFKLKDGEKVVAALGSIRAPSAISGVGVDFKGCRKDRRK
jgi:DNA gyrase subunit A